MSFSKGGANLPNIIDVTNTFKNNCKDVSKQLDHDVQIYNVTKAQYITQYVDLSTLKQTSEVKSKQGLTSTNKVNFTIDLHRHVDSGVTLVNLLEKGDKIRVEDTFNSETITMFIGYAQKPSAKHQNLKHRYSIKVYDRLYDGIETKFLKDEVWIGMYACNNADTANSIAHQLAYKMGFSDAELDFQNLTDESSNLITIDYVHIKKGKKVLSELTQLAKAFCGKVYMAHDDLLRMASPFNGENYDDVNYTIGTNIKGEINKTDIPAEHDETYLEYSRFEIQEKQTIWEYQKESSYNESNDKANIVITAGETSAEIKMKYITPICIGVEQIPVTLFEDADGNEVSLDYTLDVNSYGGTVTFTNNNSFDVYIQRFRILGEPLAKLEGNEYSYTENQTVDKVLELENNKYIQNESMAELHTKYNYLFNCKDKTRYKFKTYFTSFIELTNKLSLDTIDETDTVLVNRFSHSANKNIMTTDLELMSYIPHTFNTPTKTSLEASGPDRDKILLASKLNMDLINNKVHTLFPFNDNLMTTSGVNPQSHTVTLQPHKGRFGGGVAVTEATDNLKVNPAAGGEWWAGLSYQRGVIDEDFIMEEATEIWSTDGAGMGFGTLFCRNGNANITDTSAGTTYTISFTTKVTGGKLGDVARNVLQEYYSAGGHDNYSMDTEILWKEGNMARIKATGIIQAAGGTVDDLEFKFYLPITSSDYTNCYWYVSDIQLEQKSIATPFVDGTRAHGDLTYKPSNIGVDFNNDQWTILVWALPEIFSFNNSKRTPLLELGEYYKAGETNITLWGEGGGLDCVLHEDKMELDQPEGIVLNDDDLKGYIFFVLRYDGQTLYLDCFSKKSRHQQEITNVEWSMPIRDNIYIGAYGWSDGLYNESDHVFGVSYAYETETSYNADITDYTEKGSYALDYVTDSSTQIARSIGIRLDLASNISKLELVNGQSGDTRIVEEDLRVSYSDDSLNWTEITDLTKNVDNTSDPATITININSNVSAKYWKFSCDAPDSNYTFRDDGGVEIWLPNGLTLSTIGTVADSTDKSFWNGAFDQLMISSKFHTDDELKHWHELGRPFRDPDPKLFVPKPTSVSIQEV